MENMKPLFYFNMKRESPRVSYQVQLKDANIPIDMNSILNIDIELEGRNYTINLYVDFKYEINNTPLASVRHTIDDKTSVLNSAPRIIKDNIHADIQKNVDDIIQFLKSIKDNLQIEIDNQDFLLKDIDSSLNIKRVPPLNFNDKDCERVREIPNKKKSNLDEFKSKYGVKSNNTIIKNYVSDSDATSLSEITSDEDDPESEGQDLSIVKEIYFHLKLLSSRNQEILKERFVYIIAELLKIIDVYNISNLQKKRIIIYAVQLLLKNEHMCDTMLISTIDLVLGDIIDVMVLIDKRKIKIKQKMKCLPFFL